MRGQAIKNQSLWSVADQSIVSITNLVVGLVLIKHATKTDYGLYGLGVAAILYSVGVANAIITTQMIVLAPGVGEQGEDPFCYGLLKAQYVVYGVAAAAFSSIAVLAYNMGKLSPVSCALVITVSLSAGGVLLREFVRKYLYLKRRAANVFFMDLGHMVLVLIVLIVVTNGNHEQLHLVALILMGASSLIVSLPGLMILRAVRGQDASRWTHCLAQSWQQGRWALGGVTITWLQNQGFLYIVALFLNPAAVAEVNAARLFMAPAALFSTAANNVTLPAISRLLADGARKAARHTATKAMVVLACAVFLHCALILTIEDWLIGLLTMEAYNQIWALTALWGLVFILQVIRTRSSLLMQAMLRFRSLMWANMIGAFIAISAMLLLVPGLREKGSLIAVAMGEAVLGITLWIMTRSEGAHIR